jgi:hypothetical protein
MKTFKMAAAGLALALVSAGTALGHHSFAMFDTGKKLALKGTVVEFQWTNPHAFIEVDVKVGGTNERWSVELNSPNNLTRQGWNRKLVKAGDKVNIVVSPLRSGDKGGLFYMVTLPDGKIVRDPSAAAGPFTPDAERG